MICSYDVFFISTLSINVSDKVVRDNLGKNLRLKRTFLLCGEIIGLLKKNIKGGL